MAYKRAILVGFGDTHGGHTKGLLHPETKLRREDEQGNIMEYIPELTEAQKYLYMRYAEKDIPEVINLAGKDPIAVLHLGDLGHGKKYVSEWVTTKLSDQWKIAYMILGEWMKYKNVAVMRLVIGTASHESGEGTANETVEALMKNKYPKLNIQTLYHGLADANGAGVDYAHKGPPPGRRNWLRGNEARYYLRSLMMNEINLGNKPPQIVMRGHYHTPVKEYLSIMNSHVEHESWLVVLPSYCMMSEFAVDASQSQFIVTNGMFAFEIIEEAGKVKVETPHFFGNTLDIRTKEKIL